MWSGVSVTRRRGVRYGSWTPQVPLNDRRSTFTALLITYWMAVSAYGQRIASEDQRGAYGAAMCYL